MVVSLMNISEDYIFLQDYTTALGFNQEAFIIKKSMGNLGAAADIIFRQGQIYEKMTHFPKASELYEDALETYSELEDQLSVSRMLGHIGVIHEYDGAYDQAIKFYLDALRIAETELDRIDKEGDTEEIDNARYVIVNHLFGLGAVYSYMSEFDQALEYMQWAYRINNKYKSKDGIAGSLNNIAMIYKQQGNYIEALEYYMKSLKINQELKDKREIAGIYNNIAVVYYERGDNMDMVKEYLEKALEIKEEVGHTMGVILGLNNLGELYMELGDYDQAISYSGRSLDMAIEIHSKDDIMFACEILAATSEKMGKHEEALGYYKQFTAMKDSLFNEDKSKEIGKLEAKFEMDKKLEEEKRLMDEKVKTVNAEKIRRDNLQYSGILIFMVFVFAGIFLLGKFEIPIRLAEGLIFFAFLLFFEFSLVLLDPLIERYSEGEPAFKLLFNAILAGLIFPLHSFFETKLKSSIIKVAASKNETESS